MIKAEDRTVDLAFSSEQPYAQRWGIEVLDHSPGAMRTTRTDGNGLPILFNHNRDILVGRLRSAKIGEDKVARGTAYFLDDPISSEKFKAAQDGFLTDVSVGYQVHHMQQMDVKKLPPDLMELSAREKLPVYKITDWEPFECSLVTVPADPTVGVGRSKSPEEEVEEKPPDDAITASEPPNEAPSGASNISRKDTRIMEDKDKGFAEIEVETMKRVEKATADAQEKERLRGNEIRRIANSPAVRGRISEFMVDKAMREGTSVEEFQRAVLNGLGDPKPFDAPVTELGLSNQEIKRYSVSRAILSMCKGSDVDASFERACSDEIRKRVDTPGRGGILVPQDVMRKEATPRDGFYGHRDLSVALTGDSAGGYLRGTDHLGSEFIDLLRNRLVSRAAGARILSGLKGNISIPTRSAGATSYWLAEGSQITEGANTFGTVSLTPRNVGAWVAYTRNLLLQSNPSIDALVNGDLAASLATAIDLAVFHGTGTLQPLGIVGQGIGTVTATSVDYGKILDFQTDVAAANALTPGCCYVTTPTVAAILCATPKFTNGPQPLWEGGILESSNVCGFRGFSTNQITAGYMFFGDFSQVLIGEWGVLELLVDPYTEGRYGIINVSAFQTVDVAVRYALAFTHSNSVTAA